MREMIDTRGRLFAPHFLTEHLPVPPLNLKTVHNEEIFLPNESKDSLVCLSGSALGLESISAIIERIKGKKKIIKIQLLIGHLRYLFLKKFTLYNLKKSIESESSESKQVLMKGPAREFFQLGMENGYGGYAFLVNSLGHIYWKSSGGLFPHELEQI
jgi:hypothetical protein